MTEQRRGQQWRGRFLEDLAVGDASWCSRSAPEVEDTFPAVDGDWTVS